MGRPLANWDKPPSPTQVSGYLLSLFSLAERLVLRRQLLRCGGFSSPRRRVRARRVFASSQRAELEQFGGLAASATSRSRVAAHA